MAEADPGGFPPDQEVTGPPRRGGWARRAGKWLLILIAAIVLLVAGAAWWIDTDQGRRFLAGQIEKLETTTGLRFEIGKLDGSIYGDLVIRDFKVSDPEGVFLEAPLVRLDYRPFAYLRSNHVDIRSLIAPRVRLLRLPELRPGDPDAPILPDIDIDIGRLRIDRLIIEPPVTGQRHILSIADSIHIADQRAQVEFRLRALEGEGVAGGDIVDVVLDAVPDEDRFDLEARLLAPEGGFVTSLAGLDRRLTARIKGRGSWSDWHGTLDAALGGQGFADLRIRGEQGVFSIAGRARPGLVTNGIFARLTGAGVDIDMRATMAERILSIDRLRLRSTALLVAAQGGVDLAENQFEGLQLAGRLFEPGALARGLGGRNIRFAGVANGNFRSPRVAYDLRADRLSFNETVVQGLRARGRASVDPERIMLPISARAARISGVGGGLGELLTNVRLDGTLAIGDGRILADDLLLRSDRINARVAIVADLSSGVYRGAIDGRVDDYRIDGIGIFDIDSDIDLVTGRGGFGLEGRIALRSKRIFNESARGFLEGQAYAAADVELTPAGIVRVANVRLSSPGLRVTSGGGRYVLDGGAIDLRLAGVSRRYGPLTVLVTGTVSKPNVDLVAARPNIGLPLSNVRARIRATGSGYAIEATGDSPYGPFSADVTILAGRGPLTIDIRNLHFADIDFSGRIRRGAGGVFTGTLDMAGNGIEGTARLTARDSVQAAVVRARANGARIPGEEPILIDRAIIDAVVVLYEDAPLIDADAQLAGLRMGEMRIEKARAVVDYRGGRGTAKVLAEGRRGVPFRVAAHAALRPELVRVAATGTVNRIDFRLARPAAVVRTGRGWRLNPVRVVLPQGDVRLAGRYGEGLEIQSRFEDLDLSIVNVFLPGMGFGGSATGSLDFSQLRGTSFPRADARLKIDDFRRSGLASVSSPVDINLVGVLRPAGGAMSAVVRRGGGVIGRVKGQLYPLGPEAGSWTRRLFAAPLSGGVRYNGPADVLWSLTGLRDQRLTGPIGVAADVSGRVRDPDFAGIVRARSLTYVNDVYGTRIERLGIEGRFEGSRFELARLQGRAGEGSVSGSGVVDLSAEAGFPVDLDLAFDNARLARGNTIGATVSGDLDIVNDGNGARVSGRLELPEARYKLVRKGAARVSVLDGVRRKGQPLARPGEEGERQKPPSIWSLDIEVEADNQIFVSGMGLESEWRADLTITGTSSTPEVEGFAVVERGTYSFAGQRFDLDDSSRIQFTKSRTINPQLNISASGEVDDVTVVIEIGGRAQNPQIEFSSNPALPQDEILARVLFGGSVTELGALQAIQLAASVNSLTGSGGGGLDPLGMVQNATGIDRLRILAEDERIGRGTAVAAGFYVSNDIYLEIITDTRGFTATQIEVALTRALSLLSQISNYGTSSVGVQYSKDY
ncbi:MAG: translocation/assembly module TamB domain-containing protein [Sphingomonadaceae bacterium]